MKKLKLFLGVIFTALVMVGLAACGSQNDTSDSTTASTSVAANEVAVTVILQEDGSEFENKEIAVAKDTSLYDAMKENFEIKDEDGFITSIAGKEQDAPAQKYWTFTLNEEQVNEGAKDVTLKDGDKVIFNLAAM
ncbi:DUF4430 domain-containing protein [Enterococcus asini]|uniref:DUF4430 domain-containing protein n=1 Tax=Enterococcus asini TaxID=57732 RepID=UPI00288D7E4F|nr:DUF4430 domain-containing protein [Enterococcus asini]MDT2757737.1 DUF4430 domain-containing protein [Enterococcus asini]